ncbi:Caspase domain-containing protein [Agromyces sp. CF514]|uniref:caspase family protein n=1 Tax=Agromyces sp. CF514 TaxID=1881031 RepID=UPI0008E2AC36|nr:caspase family protein [Agromyces sp. CF514]SFR71302.1 Caspase domain-containing protein [Agromyces sp. CF514]
MNLYHYAVVVGINRYPGGYKLLRGPVADARAFATWLTGSNKGGLPRENVSLMLTPRPYPRKLDEASPLKGRIDSALWSAHKSLRARLDAAPEDQRSALRDQSRIYLFVAGHGVMPQGGDSALLDAEAEPGRQTNLGLDKYLDWFRRDGQFAEVCILADCCRGYDLLAEPGAPGFARAARAPGDVSYLFALSTSAGQLAFEDKATDAEQYRGHFSRALMQGLAGEATDPDTGELTGDRLIAYARRIVAERTKALGPGREQSVPPPHTSGTLTFGPTRKAAGAARDGERTPPPGRTKRKVRIVFPDGFTGRVELVAPDASTELWDTADGPLTRWLYDGTWYVQHEGTDMDTKGFAADGLFTVSGEDCDVQL